LTQTRDTRAGNVERDDRLRLFLALRLPPPTLETLYAWAGAELDRGVGRVVPRDYLHVTLAFLGSRPSSELPGIGAALGGAAGAVDPIELEPVGWRETRSVGMVVLDDVHGSATRLAGDLFGRLEALGVYEREARPWLPHVTALRFRERPRLRPPLPPLGRFAPSDAAAFLSRLHPSGARYEVLESFALGGVRG
jgi:RNA 2',3'-cyclic 3'-phosphodiesterase